MAPFDLVDFLEADMQQSEIVVFPPYMDILKRGFAVSISVPMAATYMRNRPALRRDGWTIVFDYAPNSEVRYAARQIFDK